jgi:hypothetical protein
MLLTALDTLIAKQEAPMKLSLITAALMLVASSAMSQHAHGSAGGPTQTGQAQFAAFAEIVTLLRDDPKTDWASVNIDELRAHLVDMDRVTTQASVKTNVTDWRVTFTVSGDALVAPSIKRMVLAHSSMLGQSSDWAVQATEHGTGATMAIQVTSQAALDQVTGLGFFGVMTVGAHHQQHHMMIAAGGSPH